MLKVRREACSAAGPPLPCVDVGSVLPHCPPPASTALGDLAHGLPGIKKIFRNLQVGTRFGSTYTQKKEKKKNPQVQSPIPWWVSLLHPERPSTPSRQMAGPKQGGGRARSWDRVSV